MLNIFPIHKIITSANGDNVISSFSVCILAIFHSILCLKQFILMNILAIAIFYRKIYQFSFILNIIQTVGLCSMSLFYWGIFHQYLKYEVLLLLRDMLFFQRLLLHCLDDIMLSFIKLQYHTYWFVGVELS